MMNDDGDLVLLLIVLFCYNVNNRSQENTHIMSVNYFANFDQLAFVADDADSFAHIRGLKQCILDPILAIKDCSLHWKVNINNKTLNPIVVPTTCKTYVVTPVLLNLDLSTIGYYRPVSNFWKTWLLANSHLVCPLLLINLSLSVDINT